MNILQLFIQAENVKYPALGVPSSSKKKASSAAVAKNASSYAILYNIHGLGNVMGIQKIEIGRTDIVWACSDPEYVGPILLRHDSHNLTSSSASVVSSASSSASQSSQALPHKIAIEIICCSNPNSVKKRFSLPEKHDGIIDGHVSFAPSVKGKHRRYTTSDLPTSPRDVSVETEQSIRSGTSLGCAFFDVDQIWNATGGRYSATLPGTSTVIHVHIARDSVLLPLPPPSRPTTITSSYLYDNAIVKSSPKLALQIRGIKLENTRNHYMLSRPNFYYEIHRKVRDVNGDTWALLHRSQRCMETLNPLWPEITLGLYPYFNYYNFEDKNDDESNIERFSKVDVKITLHDSASSTSSLLHATSTSAGASPSSKKKRASLKNNAAVLGTVTTTLQSLLSLSCAKGCNMSLQKSLNITLNGKIRGQLVIVHAEIKSTKRDDTLDAIDDKTKKLSFAAASLPTPSSVSPTLNQGSPFVNSSAPPLFATAIRQGVDESTAAKSSFTPHPSSSSSSVSVSSHYQRISSFDEYIQNGSNLELCVAIDFTNRNGLDWTTPDNAHYHSYSSSSGNNDKNCSDNDNVSLITTATGGGKRRMNDYEFILSTIGSVVSKLNNSDGGDNYNSNDIDIPVWGFGAEFEGRQYDIFQCGNVTKPKDDKCGGNGSSRKNAIVNHLLNTYHDTFECYPTLGPTETNGITFSSVIRAAMSHAIRKKKYTEECYSGKPSYTLLVIITTGSYQDVIRCKEHLVDASLKSPLSILFIGVGGGNCSNADQLEPKSEFLLEEYASRQQQQAGVGSFGKRRSFLSFVEGKDWRVPNRDAKSLAKMAFQYVSKQVVEYFNFD